MLRSSPFEVFKRYCAALCLSLAALTASAYAQQPMPVLQSGHRPRAIALRPDGSLAVTGSGESPTPDWWDRKNSDGLLKWWDRKTGLLVRSVVAHAGYVETVTFSADGDRLLSGGSDGFIRVWDADSGRRLLEFQATTGVVKHAAFSPRGDVIASCSEGYFSRTEEDASATIQLWNARTGDPIRRLTGHVGHVTHVAFDPTGENLVSAGRDKTLMVWSVATGGLLNTIPLSAVSEFVAFSPDGRVIAAAVYLSSEKTSELVFFDARAGRKVRGLRDNGEYWIGKAMSSDWRYYYVTTGSLNLKVWDIKTGRIERSDPVGQYYSKVAIDARGSTLTFNGAQGPRFWPPNNLSDPQPETPLLSHATGLAVSSDSRLVAWGSDKNIYIWDNLTASLRRVWPAHMYEVNEVAFSPDGRTLASCSNEEVKLWSTADGAHLGDLRVAKPGNVWDSNWSGSQSVAFSPDGNWLATGELRVTSPKRNTVVETLGIRLWDARTRRLIRSFKIPKAQTSRLPDNDEDKEVPYWVRSIAFSPDSKTIAADNGAQRVLLLDLKTARFRSLNGHTRHVNSVAFSADGRRLVSASFDRTVKLWNVRTGGAAVKTLRGHQDRVTTVRFSPDGRVIVAGGLDRTVRLWDTNSGTDVKTLENHDEAVTAAGVSHDGQTLFTTGLDGRVNIWSLPDMILAATIVAGPDGAWACFTPDGYYKGKDAEKYLAWRVGDEMYLGGAYRAQFSRPDILLAKLNGTPAPVVVTRPTPTPTPVTVARATPTPTPVIRPTPPLPVERGGGVRVYYRNGQSEQLYERSYALLIGNSEYADWDDLPGVRTDMTEVRKALKGQGFNVVSFDAAGSPVPDRPAMNLSQDEFNRQMTLFIRAYGQAGGNRLLIYYAGHGYTARLPDGRKMGYLVMRDAPTMPPAEDAVEHGLSDRQLAPFNQASISMDEMNTFARRILARHALFVFDSCFAGTVLFREGETRVPLYINAEVAQPVRQFLTAGNEFQKVPDESYFRKAFVSGIEGAADAADRSNPIDGYILGSELYAYIKKQVITYSSGRQTPGFGKILQQELARGDFVFVYSDAPRH